jgi:hypothetical protein
MRGASRHQWPFRLREKHPKSNNPLQKRGRRADIERRATGDFLTWVWIPKDSPTGGDVITLALCGRHARDEHENAGLWEYIRRFMQDGPDKSAQDQDHRQNALPCPGLGAPFKPPYRISGRWSRSRNSTASPFPRSS